MGGPEWGVKGPSRAGKAPWPLWLLAQQGRGLARGQARRGTRHGALEKSATLCLCEASQRGAPRGKAAAGPAVSEPIPGIPVSLPAPPAAPPGTSQQQGKTRCDQRRGKSPVLPAAILRLSQNSCPAARGQGRSRERLKGRLLMAVGQQRDLGLHQMPCHEPSTPGTSSVYLWVQRGSAREPQRGFRQGEEVTRGNSNWQRKV